MVSPLGQRITQFRELAGLSQNELSKRSGVPRPTLCCLENGTQKSLSIKNICKLAKALGITIDLLVGVKEPALAVKE